MRFGCRRMITIREAKNLDPESLEHLRFESLQEGFRYLERL